MDDAVAAAEGDGSEQKKEAYEVYLAPPTSLPEDLHGQVLRWLSVTEVLRSGRTSRAFQRAALAAVGAGLSWSPGATDCGTHGYSYCCYPSEVVGTPFLDLRAAGDSVDSRALLAVLGKVFRKPSASITAGAVEREGDDEVQGEKRGGAVAVGRPAILKGLAVCSAAIQDEAVSHALKLHGRDLEVLDLGGCRGLSSALAAAAVGQWCKSLVSLDLSGPFGEAERGGGTGGGRPGLPDAGSSSVFRPPGVGYGSVIFRNDIDRMRNDHLVSLLSAGVGGGLLSLRLRDRPDINDEGFRAVAAFCTQLRELDIGTGGGTERSVGTMGQALVSLSSAPCARSLVCLGLRNRHSIGHLDLRTLGSQFPSLRRLDLAGLGKKVDDEVLKALASTLSLSHIDLSRAHHVTVAGVSALALASPELESISLHGIIDLADSAVRALCDACPRLRHVNVSMTRLSERGLRRLASKDSLRWVNIRCCPSLLDDDSACMKILMGFRSRLSAPKHPRDRGMVLGMERPEPQSRARPPPPTRPPASFPPAPTPLGGGGGLGRSGHEGKVNDRAESSPRRGRAALTFEPLLSGGGGAALEGAVKAVAAAATAAAADGPAGVSSERLLSSMAPSSVSPAPAAATEMGAQEKGGGGRPAPLRQHGEERLCSASTVEAPAVGALEPSAAAAAAASDTPPNTPPPSLPPPPPPTPTDTPAPTPTQAPTPGIAQAAAALPLLPAGVGNLSLGQHRRRGGGAQRRPPPPDPSPRPGATWDSLHSSSGRHGREREGNKGGRCDQENFEDMHGSSFAPFDWDTIPRGSVGGLGAWRGFRGMSGDLVRRVIQELHPYAQVEFRTKADSPLGPPARKNNHGYLVHTSRWGQAWVEFEVDEQGCVA